MNLENIDHQYNEPSQEEIFNRISFKNIQCPIALVAGWGNDAENTKLLIGSLYNKQNRQTGLSAELERRTEPIRQTHKT